MTEAGSGSRDAAGAIEVVRGLLSESGYTSAGIEAIGVEPGLGVRAPDVPVLERALEAVEPLATLVRLFLLGLEIGEGAVRSTIGERADALVASGFIEIESGRAAPMLRLTPWRGFIVAHDPDPAGDLWPEHVAGPTPAAEALLALVSARPGRALDLGTGSGLLALAIAPQAGVVVATDVNAAALRYARLNATLNGAGNVEARAGSFFAPVDDERFDLVVSNPPFVISPRSDLVFRYASAGRDEVSRDVVRGAARHLSDGGFAYVMCNWIQDPRGSWLDVPRAWTEGTGCDALWLLQGVEDPLAYSVRWNLREQQLRADRYPATLDTWLTHFRSSHIEAIGSGIVVLRRRAGPNWVAGLEPPGGAQGDAGRQVQRIFAAHDLLADADGDRLDALAFTLPDAHRLDQSLVSREGEYVVEPAALTPLTGLPLAARIEPDLIPIVLRLDGSQRLAEIVDEVAAGTGQERAVLSGRARELVRGLLLLGLAVPTA